MGTNVKRLLGKRALWIIGIGCLLLAIAVFVYLGYHFGWRWTGFPQKRLFDWIQILVIPIAVAIGTFVLNRAAKRRDDQAQQEQQEREQAIETERAEEASLQAYLDYISQLLTDPDRPLRRTHMGDNLSVVARAQTLTVLERLEDGARKGSVLRFLHEAGLIDRIYPVVNLQEANLRGADLLFTDLRGANLQEANLYNANLQEANLCRANLRGADLRGAKLRGALLLITDLRGADLRGADLEGADLEGADLQEAKLRRAQNLIQGQIERAFGDDDTTLPEGIDRPKSWSARTDE